MTLDDLERIVATMPLGMTASQKEDWLVANLGPDFKPSWRKHDYPSGPPSSRLRHMQLAHEARARRAGILWDKVDLRDVYTKDCGICGLCKQPVDYTLFTIDHIKPIYLGGSHTLDNLQIAHWGCNVAKGTRYDG